MEWIARATGRSWTLRDGAREVGVVTISHGGRNSRSFFAAWSAVKDRHRYSLGAFVTLEAACERVSAFDADPAPFLDRVHRVAASAVERRR